MAELRLLRRYPDPAASTDPQVQALLTALRELPASPAVPATEFRTELRAQLVATAPRLVEEGVAEPTGERPRRSHRGLRRAVAVAGALVAVSAVVLGLLVWFSGKSLPGDTLYSVKRASEDVKLALTGGDVARGKAYLAQAGTRAEEVLGVWTDSIGSSAPPTEASQIKPRADQLMSETLDDADSDARHASRLIAGKALSSKSPDPLTAVMDWGPGQVKLLSAITSAIPVGTLHDRAATSASLANAVLQRATALRADLGCACLATAPTDDLGPIPCGPCASSPPGGPSPSSPVVPSSGSSAPGGSGGSGPGGSSATTSPGAGPNATNPQGVANPPPASSAAGGAAGGAAGAVSGQPTPTPSPATTTAAPGLLPPPVTVSSGCLNVTLILGVEVCLTPSGG